MSKYKDETLHIRLDKELKSRLFLISKRMDLTATKLVTNILSNYLSRKENSLNKGLNNEENN